MFVQVRRGWRKEWAVFLLQDEVTKVGVGASQHFFQPLRLGLVDRVPQRTTSRPRLVVLLRGEISSQRVRTAVV